MTDKIETENKAKQSRKTDAIEARVLVDCHFGKCNTVVSVQRSQAQLAIENGLIDIDPAAVSAVKGG